MTLESLGGRGNGTGGWRGYDKVILCDLPLIDVVEAGPKSLNHLFWIKAL